MARLTRSGALVAIALSWGCGVLFTEPASDEQAATLRFQLGQYDTLGLAIAVDDLDRVLVEIDAAGIVRDTVVPLTNEPDGVTARLTLAPYEIGRDLQLAVELRAGISTLFEGTGTATGGWPTANATISVVPRPDGITGVASIFLTSLGATRQLDNDVVFVNNTVLPGAVLSYESVDTAVAFVTPGGLVTGVANGIGQVDVTWGALGRSVQVFVRQVPAPLTGLAPGDTTIADGTGFQMRLLGTDAGGNALEVGAQVVWTAFGAVAVDTLGYVTTIGQGVGYVSADLGQQRVSATVTVN